MLSSQLTKKRDFSGNFPYVFANELRAAVHVDAVPQCVPTRTACSFTCHDGEGKGSFVGATECLLTALQDSLIPEKSGPGGGSRGVRCMRVIAAPLTERFLCLAPWKGLAYVSSRASVLSLAP